MYASDSIQHEEFKRWFIYAYFGMLVYGDSCICLTSLVSNVMSWYVARYLLVVGDRNGIAIQARVRIYL